MTDTNSRTLPASDREAAILDWMLRNTHSCPFADDCGLDFDTECKGFGTDGCRACILRNIVKFGTAAGSKAPSAAVGKKKGYVNPIPAVDMGKHFEVRLEFRYPDVIPVDEAKCRIAVLVKDTDADTLAGWIKCTKIKPLYPADLSEADRIKLGLTSAKSEDTAAAQNETPDAAAEKMINLRQGLEGISLPAMGTPAETLSDKQLFAMFLRTKRNKRSIYGIELDRRGITRDGLVPGPDGYAAYIRIQADGETQKSRPVACPPRCLRCGKNSMDPVLYSNALSRHADVYICSDCGTDEAKRAMPGDPRGILPFQDWAIERDGCAE